MVTMSRFFNRSMYYLNAYKYIYSLGDANLQGFVDIMKWWKIVLTGFSSRRRVGVLLRPARTFRLC